MSGHLRRWLQRPLILAVAVLVGGCGFHLAGRTPVPPQLKAVYVDYVDPYHVGVPPLQNAITERLIRSGAKVVSQAQEAQSILRLSNLAQAREAVSIGPDGRALEYRLIVSVSYELASRGKVLLPPETQTVASDYTFNAQQILAKEKEKNRLEKYLQDELAELLLLRINARLTHLPSGSEALPAAPSTVGAPDTRVVPAG